VVQRQESLHGRVRRSPRRADLLCACFGKRHEPEVGLAFALDDDSSLVEVCGGYLIEPFRGDPSH
jgi:hypothetical protein